MSSIETSVRLRETRALSDGEPAFRIGNWFALVGIVTVGAWLTTFWSLVIRARIATGEWPRAQYGIPLSGPLGDYRPSTIDPKAFALHDDLAWIFLYFQFIIAPLAIVVLVLSFPFARARASRAMTTAFLIACALAVATLWLDPFGFVDWFSD
jgi:hypothetical protein